MSRLYAILTATVILVSLCLIAGPVAGAEMPCVLRSVGQTIYVPIYSHIYIGDRERPFLLAATLSIRNTDPANPFTLTAVDYYDSDGKRLKRYLEKPRVIGPLATIRYVIGERDEAGGSGANFIVEWTAKAPVTMPIIESVMIGTQTQQGISFTSRGQVIAERFE